MSRRRLLRASVVPCLAFGLFAACGGNAQRERDGTGGEAGMQAGAVAQSGASGSVSGSAGSNGGSSVTAGSGGASAFGGNGGRAGSPALGGRAGSSNAGGGSGAPEGGRAGTGPFAGSAGISAGVSGTGNEAGFAGEGSEAGAPNDPHGLSWPIDCIPNDTCLDIGFPDIDGDGAAHDCGAPGYVGHEGTDIRITPAAQAAGMAVRAAVDGVVVFAFDGKYDQCPNPNEPDCQVPPTAESGSMVGTTVCSATGPYCGTGQASCFWCFEGGNVIVIRHEGVPGVFATRYDHLKRDSVLVEPGDEVTRGQKIAEAASAGNSTSPHLHFEVWGTGFYELADPWAGACGPNTGQSLWAYDPPWSE